MSFSGIVSSYSFNLLLFTQVFTALTSTIKYNEYVTDMGKNITIPCTSERSTIWLKGNQSDNRQIHASGGSLKLYNLTRNDAGLYTCLVSTTSREATLITNESPEMYQSTDGTYIEAMKVRLFIRTVPCAVNRITMRISTILGVLIWDYNRTSTSGYGYPLKSFTAEYRVYSPENSTANEWERLDPINISPNIRYMEIYHLLPNTTYEFRIWGNNYIGAGEKASTIVTTLAEIGDEELIRILMRDAKDFDVMVWFYAVGIVMGSMVILGLTVCILLIRDCYEDDGLADADEWETLDLIPNIILNPGFFEPDDPDNPSPPYTRTIIFGEDVLSSSEEESEEEPIPFKRKLSLFFTGDTIKRL